MKAFRLGWLALGLVTAAGCDSSSGGSGSAGGAGGSSSGGLFGGGGSSTAGSTSDGGKAGSSSGLFGGSAGSSDSGASGATSSEGGAAGSTSGGGTAGATSSCFRDLGDACKGEGECCYGVPCSTFSDGSSTGRCCQKPGGACKENADCCTSSGKDGTCGEDGKCLATFGEACQKGSDCVEGTSESTDPTTLMFLTRCESQKCCAPVGIIVNVGLDPSLCCENAVNTSGGCCHPSGYKFKGTETVGFCCSDRVANGACVDCYANGYKLNDDQSTSGCCSAITDVTSGGTCVACVQDGHQPSSFKQTSESCCNGKSYESANGVMCASCWPDGTSLVSTSTGSAVDCCSGKADGSKCIPNGGAGGAGGSSGAGGSGGSSGSAGKGGSSGTGGSAGSSAGTSGAGGTSGGNVIPKTCAEARLDVGCCAPDGDAYFCSGNKIAHNVCSGSCGWVAASGYYDCGGTGSDPSGENPKNCGQ